MKKSIFTSLFIILLSILFALAGCSPNSKTNLSNITNIDSTVGSTLVCFGDSLTSGIGGDETNFPLILATELSIPVINSGRSGDTTYSALPRLERDLFAHDPKIVIVQLGANDYLLWGDEGKPGHGLDDTFKNIEVIIDRTQEYGAAVVLAAIPLSPTYKKNYERLAREKGALLIPNIMKGIYRVRDLMSLDRTHPNDEGYKVMTETILEYLRPLLKIKNEEKEAQE